jgi:hypothetical protein
MIRSKHAWSPGKICKLLALTITSVCLSLSAFGQTDGQFNNHSSDTSFYVSYYNNAQVTGFPDARLDIVNTGARGGYGRREGQSAPFGDLCANIYVFTSDQQMVECCSCPVSPNGHIQLSLNNNLTNNPLTATTPHHGAIKIVASNTLSNGSCASSPNVVAGTNYEPYGELRAWNTHVRPIGSGQFSVTETAFRVARLDHYDSELEKIQSQCYVIWTVAGSGHGRCSCGSDPK